MKKRLVAFLSFFQINLGALHQNDTQLQCDCNLFDFATLISENVPEDFVSLLSGSKYPHTLLLSSWNFQMWKCEVNPVLMLPVSQESFLLMPHEYFICEDHSLRCPDKCTCYRGANDTRRILDCRNQSHTSLPINIELSDSMSQLIVNLEHNNIANLPECDDPQYKWLKNVSTLNIQYNEIKKNNHIICNIYYVVYIFTCIPTCCVFLDLNYTKIYTWPDFLGLPVLSQTMADFKKIKPRLLSR